MFCIYLKQNLAYAGVYAKGIHPVQVCIDKKLTSKWNTRPDSLLSDPMALTTPVSGWIRNALLAG